MGIFDELGNGFSQFWEGMKTSPEDVALIKGMEGEDTPFDFTPLAPIALATKGGMQGLFKLSPLLQEKLGPKMLLSAKKGVPEEQLFGTPSNTLQKVFSEDTKEFNVDPLTLAIQKKWKNLIEGPIGQLSHLPDDKKIEVLKDFKQWAIKNGMDRKFTARTDRVFYQENIPLFIKYWEQYGQKVRDNTNKVGAKEESLFGKPASTLSNVFSESPVNINLPKGFSQDPKDMYDHFMHVNNYITNYQKIPAYNPTKILSQEVIIPPTGGRGIRLDEVLDLFSKQSPEAIDRFKSELFDTLPKRLKEYIGPHGLVTFLTEENLYTIAASFPKQTAAWLSKNHKYWYY